VQPFLPKRGFPGGYVAPTLAIVATPVGDNPDRSGNLRPWRHDLAALCLLACYAGRIMARIPVTRRISIDESELSESFVRSSGAGGQNIQKVETAVQLRFDAANSPSLSEGVRERLLRMAGHRATLAGEIIIIAQRHRTQLRNREDALERLLELIRAAAAPPPPERRPTKPTRASKERRLDGKARRSRTKNLRSGPTD
jgi:ribosome-associated protein